MNDFTPEQLQATLDLMPGYVWYANQSGALTFVNQRFANYLGLPSDDSLRVGLKTGGFWDGHIHLLHRDDQDGCRKRWAECIRSGSIAEFTFRVRNAAGQYRWFLNRVEPLISEGGRPQGWIGINFDIEERMQAQFFLAEGQRIGDSGSWALNAAGFEHWSDGLFRIHGIEPGNPPTRPEFLALLHPEDRDFVAQAIHKLLAERIAFDFTKRIVRPGGAIRHIRYVGMPSANEGLSGKFLGIGIDVTAQMRLAAELRRSERQWQQIVDLSPQLIGVLGPNREHIYINRSAIDYLGISLEEWVQGSKFGHVHPEDRERHNTFQRSLSIDCNDYTEVRLRKGDGSYRWFLTSFMPVRDSQGKLLRWYISCTDIDERKIAQERLQKENVALREEIDKTSMFEEIVGISPALMTLLSRVTKVAASDSTVLIAGETGTGKELVARAIHRRSRRVSRPFVAVNCAAIPRELIASELFGHEKGAFTGATQRRLGRFEMADGGTILLDEVGELLPDAQVALLRVLQEQEFERVGGGELVQVDVRVIAATNRDLGKAVANGTFREDLFYRLNVFPVNMPPLRERIADIPLLVDYFIDRYARKMGKSFRRIDKQTLDRLRSYPWPGNVRELQNVIERSVIVCDSAEFTIDENWLSARKTIDNQLELPAKLATHERVTIEEALRACGGRISGPSGAAVRLGIPRSTLDFKIRAYKIDKAIFRHRKLEK